MEEKIFKKNKFYSLIIKQLYLSFILFAFITGLVTYFVIDYQSKKSIETSAYKNAEKKLQEKEKKFEAFIKKTEIMLHSIRESKIFNNYLDNQKEYEAILNDYFYIMANSHYSFMQFRYIDKNGMEKIRVDRKTQGDTPFLVEKEKLQNKSNRYYFSESKTKPYHKVWFSNLDLNIEHGNVEIPYKPTLRAMLPVYKQGEFNGIIIINYFMDQVLKHLLSDIVYDFKLINNYGEILVSTNENESWGSYKDKKLTIKDLYPYKYKNFLNQNSYKDDMYFSKKFSNVELPLKLILILNINKKYISDGTKNIFEENFIYGIVFIIFSLLFSFLFAKKLNLVFNKHEDEMQKVMHELEISKKKALHSSAAKSEFLANMSHEIRTPMNGILGLNNLMMKTELDSLQKNYTNRIRSSSDALLNIINDILDYSKIEAGKLNIIYNDFKLDQLLKNSSELFSYEINSKGVELSLKIDPLIHNNLIGDSLRLTQVLNNLLSNALKFTDNGKITINVTQLYTLKAENESKLRFSIIDTGIGISEANQKKLFQAFEQGESSNTKKYGGTGLGLKISKQLVELMGGKIDLKSKQGVGSEFFFELVLKHSEISTESNEVFEEDKYIEIVLTQKYKALLAEDDNTNQIIASTILKNYGFEVDVVNNGLEAVKMVKKKKYDIVFMDLQMPNMDGFEATKNIRTFNNELIIVAVSASVMDSDKVSVKKVGMQEHLAKPIDMNKLNKVIQKYFEYETKNKGKTSLNNCTYIDGIDIESVLNLLDDDPKEVYSLYHMYKEEYKDFNKKVSHLDINSQAFKAYIHKLKGSSGSLKINKIYNLCTEILTLDNPQIKIDELKTELAFVVKELEKMCLQEL